MTELIQGTDAWHQRRLGRVTASKINAVMSTLKSGAESADRRNYRVQLAVERMTGQPTDFFVSGPMQRGTEMEPFAREAYSFSTDLDVEQIGFLDHPTIPMAGASPDGLIGADGMVEIKCPNSANHIDWMLAGKVPSAHVNQMQWQMECAGREWNDFVSYDDRLPIDLQLFVKRLRRDDILIARMREEVALFLEEVDEMVAKLEEFRKSR